MTAQVPAAQMRLTLTRAGDRWDAVGVPAGIGMRVLAELGDVCGGAVLDDDVTLFFIAVGSGDHFADLDHVRTYRSGALVLIPADDRIEPPGPHWGHPPGRASRLTPATALAQALSRVTR